VKICGIRSKEEAVAVAEAGADLLGLMFVEKSKRVINIETAKEISQAIRALRFGAGGSEESGSSDEMASGSSTPWLTTRATRLSLSHISTRPLLVGVFQDSSLDTILGIISKVQLDIVQLHGSEPIDWAHHIPVPVIRVFHVDSSGKGVEGITRGGAHHFVLLDSLRDDQSGVSGGSGKVFDWDLAKKVVEDGEIVVNAYSDRGEEKPNGHTVTTVVQPATKVEDGSASSSSTETALSSDLSAPSPPVAPVTDEESKKTTFPLPIILAGGLNPENVAAAIAKVHPWAVDVSGGVENENETGKDIEKVKAFINCAKGLNPPDSSDSEEGNEDFEEDSEDEN
jgi:anthranilate synthase/indole-3-glycerol phosphate synthase/phosphoribosylanthranilate isomerase